jgi:peptidase E
MNRMTKFVLHGGFNKERGFIEDAFFQEMLKDTPVNVKVLFVYFAEGEEMLQLRIAQAKEQFQKNKGVKSLDIKIASEDTFLEDCAWADIIFLAGGRTTRLMDALKKYPNLGQVFSGKVVGGDSAGVNALGHFFYSKSSKEIGQGLKLIPFKVVVHYSDGAPNPLEAVQPEMETLFLREYETIVKYY